MSTAWGQTATAAVALASVLALILILSWIRRKIPMASLRGRTPGLLAIRETLVIDPRRRLHLIEIQGAQALLLTGGGRDILIGWRPGGQSGGGG